MTTTTAAPSNSAWLELPDKSTHLLNRECYIGRISGSEIVLPDHRISRRHAVVQAQGKRFALVDLGSTNGTFLNEARIFRPTMLNDADIIGVGAQRIVFCQHVVTGEESDDSLVGTSVVVAKTACWMLLISPGESQGGSEWASRATGLAVSGNGRAKRLPGATDLVHWRADVATPAAVRTIIGALAILPAPRGVSLVLHHGMVRVSVGATAAEENLLGADVTFTHRLAAVAMETGEFFCLSEAAVESLAIATQVRALGARAIRDIPGTHPVFFWPGK